MRLRASLGFRGGFFSGGGGVYVCMLVGRCGWWGQMIYLFQKFFFILCKRIKKMVRIVWMDGGGE